MATPAAWLTSALEAADAATQALGLQEDVVLTTLDAPDAYGAAEEGPDPVSHAALVQRKEGLMKTADGQEHAFRAMVTFLRPVTITPGRTRITLYDGMTGPVLVPSGGLTDPATGGPYMRTVYLGGR